MLCSILVYIGRVVEYGQSVEVSTISEKPNDINGLGVDT